MISAIVLSNIGGVGTFIDILDVVLTGSTGFSILSGDTAARLNDANLSEEFSLRFDTTGLGSGSHNANLEFVTSEGSINYSLIGAVEAQAIPEPGTLALFGLGLVGLGIARRRKVA